MCVFVVCHGKVFVDERDGKMVCSLLCSYKSCGKNTMKLPNDDTTLFGFNSLYFSFRIAIFSKMTKRISAKVERFYGALVHYAYYNYVLVQFRDSLVHAILMLMHGAAKEKMIDIDVRLRYDGK